MAEELRAKLILDAEGNAPGWVDSFYQKFVNMVKGVSVGEAALAALTGAIAKLAQVAIAKNFETEKAIRSIGTLSETVYRYTGAVDQRTASTRDSTQAVHQLAEAQFSVLGTETQLFGLYQRMLPGLAFAGETSTKKMSEFTVTVAQLADVMGKGYEEVGSEMLRLLTPGQQIRGELARVLQSLGVTPEIIASWRAQGTVIDEVTKRLEPIRARAKDVMSAADGMAASIKKAFTDILKEAGGGAGLGDLWKGMLTGLRDFLLEVKDGIPRVNVDLVGAFRSLFTVSTEVLSAIGFAFKAAFAPVTDFLSGQGDMKRWVTAFVNVGEVAVRVLLTLGAGLGTMAQMVRHPFDAISALVHELVSKVIGVLGGIFEWIGSLADKFPKIAAALSAMSGVDVKAVGQMFKDAGAGAKEIKEAYEDAAVASNQFVKGAGQTWDDANAKAAESHRVFDSLRETIKGLGTEHAQVYEGIIDKTKRATTLTDAQRAALRSMSDFLTEAADQIASVGMTGWQKMQADFNLQLDKFEIGFKAKMASLAKEGLATEVSPGVFAATSEQAKKAVEWYGILRGVMTEVNNDLIKQQRTIEESLKARDWQTYFEELRDKAMKTTHDWTLATQQALTNTAEMAYKTAVSLADGTRAALWKITSEIKTEGQIWADYLEGVWNSLSKGFDDAFYDVISGKFSSLGDTLKSVWDGILHSFSSMVSQMVQRWLLGKDQMAAGDSSGSGGFGGLLNSLFGGKDRSYENQQGFVGPKSQGGGGSEYVGYAAAAYQGISAILGGLGRNKDTLTYNNQGYNVGYGGTAKFGDYAAAAAGVLVTAAATTAMAAAAAGAATAAIVPVWGWVAAAVILLVGAILSIANGPAEGKLGFNMGDMSPRAKGLGGAAYQVYGTTLGGLSDVVKAGGGSTTDFMAQMRGGADEWIKQWKIGFHAGNNDDLSKDITSFFQNALPKMVESFAFGQYQSGFKNDQTDAGAAGTTGIPNFIRGSFDPNAPIPKMLAGLGFTAAKISEIATQIDDRAPDEFAKYLKSLVTLVSGVNALRSLTSKSYAETVAAADAEGARNPAQVLAASLASVIDLAKTVSSYIGDEQITKGQEALTAAQAFYDQAKAAMLQLAAMAKQTTQEYQDSVKKIEDALKTPAELFAQSTADLQADYERMRFAADSTTLQAGWAKARTDFEAIAGTLIQRIQSIKTLLSDMETLQQAMAAGPGPDATKNPGEWLAQNMAAMAKYKTAMLAASPGSPEQIAAATSFAGLIRDRYQMEMDLLQRVKDTIKSITDSIDQQLFGMQLENTPMTGDKAKLLYDKMKADYVALGKATTVEEYTALTAEIQQLAGQTLGLYKKGDPGYDQIFALVTEILNATKTAALGGLTGLEKKTTVDISTLGTQLSAAEGVMKKALEAVQRDLTDLEWHFAQAAAFVTRKMNEWGVEIANQLNALDPILKTMVTNFTDVNTALGGAVGTGGGGNGLPRGLDDLATSADGAGGAFDRFAAKLDAWDPGAGGAAEPGAGTAGGGANVVAGALYAQRTFGSRNYAGTGV